MKIPSHLINLEYDPSHDVLQAEWPHYDSRPPAELRYALEQVLTALRHYDVGFLLLDARAVAVFPQGAGLADPGTGFLKGLRQTRVRRVALVVQDTETRDRLMREAPLPSSLPYLFQTFVRLEVALGWLRA